MKPRSRTIVATVVLMLLGMPLAFVLTILLVPFWNWLEAGTGVEATGRFGPATWCFWLVYLLMLAACAIGAWRAIRKVGGNSGMDA